MTLVLREELRENYLGKLHGDFKSGLYLGEQLIG